MLPWETTWKWLKRILLAKVWMHFCLKLFLMNYTFKPINESFNKSILIQQSINQLIRLCSVVGNWFSQIGGLKIWHDIWASKSQTLMLACKPKLVNELALFNISKIKSSVWKWCLSQPQQLDFFCEQPFKTDTMMIRRDVCRKHAVKSQQLPYRNVLFSQNWQVYLISPWKTNRNNNSV